MPSPGNCANSIKCGNVSRNSLLSCRIAFAGPKVSAHAGREITDAAPAPALTCKNSRLCMSGMVLRLFPSLIDEGNLVTSHQSLSALVPQPQQQPHLAVVTDNTHNPGFRFLKAISRFLQTRSEFPASAGPFLSSNLSISSITRFIFLSVSSSGSSVVMSTPASFSRSIGYFDLPEEMNFRSRPVAPGSP